MTTVWDMAEASKLPVPDTTTLDNQCIKSISGCLIQLVARGLLKSYLCQVDNLQQLVEYVETCKEKYLRFDLEYNQVNIASHLLAEKIARMCILHAPIASLATFVRFCCNATYVFATVG